MIVISTLTEPDKIDTEGETRQRASDLLEKC